MENNGSFIHTDASDESLAALVQSGDTESFGVLMARFEPKLLRYGRTFLPEKDDIDDIVQEVFIKTYENIQSFDASLRFSPWIYRVAHNAFINEIKRKKRSYLIPDFDTFLSYHVSEDPNQRERDRTEAMALIEKGLQTLSPAYKEVVILYYLENMSYKEIADIMQVPMGTVGIRIKRARDTLKKAYAEKDSPYGK